MRPPTILLTVACSTTVLADGSLPEAMLDSLAGAATEAAAVARQGLDAVDPAVRKMLAPALAVWIADARDAAVALGVEKIEPEIRAALKGHVPPEILRRVRWRIDDTQLTVQHGLFSMGYTPAVTVDHVILFATPDDAADPKLWAHELYHVMQYREWGVEGFARRYVDDHAVVEREAWEFRWQWMKATGRVPTPDAARAAR